MEENLRILKPYWRGLPLIILAMIVCYLLAKKYLNYVTPMYEGTAKIRLADINEGASNSNLFKDFDVFALTNKLKAEIEVMKSQVLINKVLDSLSLDIEILRVGSLKSVELFGNSPIKIEALEIDPKHYDRTFKIEVLSEKKYKIINPKGKIKTGKFGQKVQFENTQLLLEINQELLAEKENLQIIDNYEFKIRSRKKLIKHIQHNLDIMSVDKEVPVIRISYQSPNPTKAALIPNQLAKIYIQDYIDTKYKTAEVTVGFLEEEIEGIAKKLSFAEDTLQHFRDYRGITNLRQETETDLRKIAQMKVQKTNLKMSLRAISDLEKYVKEGKEEFLELAPNYEAFTDLLSTEIIKKIKTLQAEKKDLLLTYTPEAGKVQVVDRKLNDLTSYLVESVQNTRKHLKTQYDNLTYDIGVAKTALIPVPEKEKLLNILDREFQLFQDKYNFLNEKKIEAEIARAAKVAFHRIITPAQTPDKPVSPNRTIIKIVSMLLGMFGMIVLIFLVHLFKGKVNDKQTIESNSLIPLLSLTPYFKKSKDIKRHFQKEVSHLEIKGFLKEKEVICVSAFDRKSGASFNAINLSRGLSQQGIKLLIIDIPQKIKNLKDENIDIFSPKSEEYLRLTPQRLKAEIVQKSTSYDLTLILNDKIEEALAISLMSVVDKNLIVLDSRITSSKKIVQADLLHQEYNLPQPHFLLNRYGYNPNIIKQAISKTQSLTKKFKKK